MIGMGPSTKKSYNDPRFDKARATYKNPIIGRFQTLRIENTRYSQQFANRNKSDEPELINVDSQSTYSVKANRATNLDKFITNSLQISSYIDDS